jgi:phosphoglycolate phosphatase
MPRLLLFDIDQTLIRTAGAGRLAMDRALEEILGIPDVSKGILFDGRTDYGIFLEALSRHSDAPADLLAPMQEAYLRYLPAALEEKGGIVLEAVGELLDALDAEGAAMGVATGNMREGAAAKLGFFGLWERFRGGGFGDSVSVRSELIVAGIEDIAREHGHEPNPANAVVLGDTPLDVEAALAAGATAIGVATGRFSVEELLASGAHHAVADLTETQRLVELLLGE